MPATSGTPAACRRPKSCIMRCQDSRYVASLPPLTSVGLLRQARWFAIGKWSATGASARVHVAGLLRVGALEGRERRVDHGLVVDEELDEVAHLLRVEIDGAGALADQVEAQDRARVRVRVRDEVQHHLVDVLQLVVALAHDALGARESRHVAADAQAPRMGVGRDRLGPLGLDRVVELHLAVAALGVPVDRVLRFLHVVHDEAAARGKGALALDVARGLDVRPDRACPRRCRPAAARGRRCRCPCRASVVTPPAICRIEFQASSCACMSNRPGSSARPAPSMTVAGSFAGEPAG